MVVQTEKIAKRQHMTRSELMRTALRQYMEELHFDEVVRVADHELKAGKLKILPPGGLVALMKK